MHVVVQQKMVHAVKGPDAAMLGFFEVLENGCAQNFFQTAHPHSMGLMSRGPF